MLTVISDTHGTDGHRLEGETLAAVREADRVVHAGDFTTETVLDAVESETTALTAVYGNNDTRGVRGRLTDVATLSWAGLTVLVVHGHEHTETALSMLARQEDADVVVVGHSHRPELAELDGRLLVNPGSYADPRRYEPAHAELDVEDGRLTVRLRSPDGTTVSSITRKR
ncbi:metallophosphoesterase [Halomicroarcula limicola]|uniref:Phosphoesterase n=1 Tax=Haloarcula limicola TaxID=1429915 RepID=A0A8J7YBY5_9EURY|nr:metallophosphoesterase [Halomicroarcula limicola]MBV0925623.1 metallophosphoesterase [Halomicroarcula limicola]